MIVHTCETDPKSDLIIDNPGSSIAQIMAME